MGRPTDIRNITLRIKEANERVNKANHNLQKAGLTPGNRQALVNTIHENTQKIKHYLKKIGDLTSGALIQVDFKVTQAPTEAEVGKSYRVYYTNMLEKEARDLITLLMLIQGYTIDILECQTVVTQNRIIPL